MKANFNQILHQSTVRANTTPLPALSNSDQLTKISFLKKNKPETYKSVSESVKFSAGKGSVLKGSWISKRTDPIGKRLLSYLYLSLLVLFSVALGIYGYQQIFKDVVQQYAYPQAPSPTTPNRYLSFQARLTDSSDNPITVPTDFRFIVYNNETASASASADQIPVLTQEGDLVLAQANPMVYSSSGTFSIKGQCVTGDSLLPIMTRSNLVKIEPHSIKGLLDMGIQPVYKLTTEDGKTIRTTGNHPYLVRKNLNNSNLEDQNNQQKSNNHQGESDDGLSVNIKNINLIFHIYNFLKINANPTETIAPKISAVKINDLFLPFSEEKLGTIITAPSQPAAKLTNKSEKIKNHEESNLINTNLTQWIKVIYLREGDEIATIDGFEKITSIGILPAEQVYDVEVENTHNFVANDIIAHNTYIVKGQCVTGDSLLPIMTRSNLVKIEPHSIKGLLDMGIQPVYKLTTEDGWTKVVYLEKGEEIAVARLDSARLANKESLLGNSGSLGNENNQKKNSDHQQTISHRSASQEIFGIHHNNLLLSDNANVINNPSIPNDKLGSNKLKYSPTEETPKNPGLITNIPNQPEVKLTSISLDTSITAFSEKNLINNSLDSNNSDVKFPAGRSLGVGWVKIASIEYAGEEQVYDIEVENTHNFVANGIIYDKVQPCLHKEKSLSGSTPNQITGSRHQTKGYNNQPKIALNQHLTSLSPYKKEVHHNRKNAASNSRQPKSISKVRFNHALTPLTNNIAKLRKTYLSWPWDNFSINQSIIHPSIDIKYIKFALAYL